MTYTGEPLAKEQSLPELVNFDGLAQNSSPSPQKPFFIEPEKINHIYKNAFQVFAFIMSNTSPFLRSHIGEGGKTKFFQFRNELKDWQRLRAESGAMKLCESMELFLLARIVGINQTATSHALVAIAPKQNRVNPQSTPIDQQNPPVREQVISIERAFYCALRLVCRALSQEFEKAEYIDALKKTKKILQQLESEADQKSSKKLLSKRPVAQKFHFESQTVMGFIQQHILAKAIENER